MRRLMGAEGEETFTAGVAEDTEDLGITPNPFLFFSVSSFVFF
jgi:hypothetical protein